MFGITSGLLIGTAVFLKTSKLLKSIKHIAYCAAYDQPSLTQIYRVYKKSLQLESLPMQRALNV